MSAIQSVVLVVSIIQVFIGGVWVGSKDVDDTPGTLFAAGILAALQLPAVGHVFGWW